MKVLAWIKAGVAWFVDPAHPGRKRGVAAVAGAASAVLRVYGQHGAADVVGGLNEFVQSTLVPGLDLTALVFAVVGLAHARARRVPTPEAK